MGINTERHTAFIDSSFMKALDAMLNELLAIAASAMIEYTCSIFNKSS